MDKELLEREVKEIADSWKGKEGNLIMVLHQIQNRYGYVPRGPEWIGWSCSPNRSRRPKVNQRSDAGPRR